MAAQYSAESLQVLSGLEPVRRRPGMYTDVSRPNHLVQEVVDNSVDEALAGFAREIEVTLYRDGSVEVIDDGRGMPVDDHPEHGISGVELILTRLHAGAKFDDRNYTYAGGLHGVGVSVVNALSEWLEVEVKRGGQVYRQRYESGEPVAALEPVGAVGRRNSGTRIRFKPAPAYFDSPRVAPARLRHLLRAKAVLAPGLAVALTIEGQEDESSYWVFEDGLAGYLNQALGGADTVPVSGFTHSAEGNREAVEWAVKWVVDGGDLVTESYVNLIPTAQGGAHVSGLRSGLLQALKEFCEFRDLLPRGVKLTGDDLWAQCAYVLSAKLSDPQFSGQTKERLASRNSAVFIGGVAKDAFSLWLNENPKDGERIAELAIGNAQRRTNAAKKVARKKTVAGPRPARQAGRLLWAGYLHRRTLPGGRRLRRRFRQAGPGSRVPGRDAPEGQDSEHLGGGREPGSRIPGGARYRHSRGRRPGYCRPVQAPLRQGLRARGRRLGRRPHRHPPLRPVPPALPPAGRTGTHLRSHAAAVPHRCRQGSLLRPGRG